MTCADAILDALSGGPRAPKALAAHTSYGRSVVGRYLAVLRDQGRVVRVAPGVWALTGTPPQGRARKPRPPRTGATAAARAFGITRQRASYLVRAGLAWQEGGQWVRKHTKPGRPKS